ncbi:MAG TPA: transglutaminaseTgpA domain-containing protein, partial [Acidimicrobiales bacterium]|nr:transglutaminaseTgpA domain-containing protein [Acidimicrobiales bacterium]
MTATRTGHPEGRRTPGSRWGEPGPERTRDLQPAKHPLVPHAELPAAPRGLGEPGAANLALALLTLVTSLGLGRLFTGDRWLGPLLVAPVAGHAVAWGLRRRRMAPAAAVVAGLAGVFLVSVLVVLPQTTAYGFLTRHTLHTLGHDLIAARDAFRQETAPTLPIAGFLIVAMGAVGIAALLADWAAFRIGTTLEAVVPAFSLFLFTAALAGRRGRGVATAAELAALLLFVLLHQAEQRSRAMAWFASRARGGTAALLRGGLALGAVAVAAGLVIGPSLPGGRGQGLIELRHQGGSGPGHRTTVSPLVDIRARLTGELSNTEVFTVTSSEAAYWRLTSLETFDGSIWSSNGSYDTVRSRLPGVPATPAGTDEVDQTFTVGVLSSIWLPVAYRPQQIDGVKGVSFDRDSASLITPEATVDGDTYHVRSAVEAGHLTPAALAAAPPATNVSSRYLDLPLSSISPRVVALARGVVAGQTTVYGKARALQDFFRSPRFTYSLNVRPGHDERALESFLFVTRRGYCEQFAGAYAVLARLAGLPTRVAVGFTPGDLRGGAYHVLGLHAHAWPEVLLGGYGWVAFEPTPGRGEPGAQGYTGVPPSQARVGGGNSSAGESTAPSTSPTSVPVATTAPPRPQPKEPGAAGSQGGSGPLTALVRLAALLAAAAVLAVVWLGLVSGARVAVHRRRWRRATGPAEQVLAAWSDAAEVLARAGLARSPTETLEEYAGRAEAALGQTSGPVARPQDQGAAPPGQGAGRAVRTLAADAIVASYAPA